MKSPLLWKNKIKIKISGFELVCINKAAFTERIKRWCLSPSSGQCPVNIHAFDFISIEIDFLSELTVTLQMRKTNTYQHVSSSASVQRNHRASQHDPNLLIITLRRLKPVGTAESLPVAWWHGPDEQDGNPNRLSAALLQAHHLKSKIFPNSVSILNPLKKTWLF